MSSSPIIPAGELGAWQAWQPGSLGRPAPGPASADARDTPPAAAVGDETPGAATVPPLPAAPADEQDAVAVLTVAYPTAAELEAVHQQAWQAGYDAGFAAGRADGLIQGQQEGQAAGRAHAEEAVRERFKDAWAPLDVLLQSFAGGVARLESQLAPELLALALECAGRLSSLHLLARPEALQALIADALAPVAAELSQLRVRVNPADQQLLTQFFATEYPQATVKWLADPALARGGCVIDTMVSHLDLSLEARELALRQALGLDGDV